MLKYNLLFKSCTLTLISVGLCCATEPVWVAADDILFLAHFNTSVTLDYGNIEGMINRAEITSGSSGYSFSDSIPTAEALNVNRNRRYVVFPAEGNIDVRQGTMQFMLKPQWGADGYGHCVFFKLVFDADQREGLAWRGVDTFIIQKPPRRNELVFAHAERSIRHSIPFGDNLWYHLAVTWDQAAAQRAFYVNGEKVGEEKYHRMTERPIEFTLGAPRTWNAQSYLDEVRILQRVLSDAEIRQDYQALVAGREFSLPGEKKTYPVPELVPRPVDTRSNGFVASLKEVEFTVPKCNEEAKVDGILDEDQWGSAGRINGLLMRNGEGGEVSTLYRLFYTDMFLYLAAELEESDMQNLVAMYDQRDQPIYNDDCIEFLFDMDGKSERFYHFVVNPLGIIYDARLGDTNWNGNGIETAGVRHDDGWRIEMRIPFAAFGITAPLPGEYWGARFGRERRAGKREVSAVPRVLEGSYNQRAFLGVLRFTSGTDTSDWKLTSTERKFQLGYNRFSLHLANQTKQNRTLRLQAIQFDADNRRLQEDEQDVHLAAGAEKNQDFTLAIVDDRCERLVLLLSGDDNSPLATDILSRGFTYTVPGVREQKKRLQQLRCALGSIGSVRHPIYEGAIKAIARLESELQQFQDSLEEAVKNERILPSEQSANIAAWVNGFQQFQEKYRYLAWQVSPWDYGAPAAVPPMDYSFNNLQLQYQQGGNEREVAVFVLSGLLCGSRLDLRVVPRSYERRNEPFISCDNFEVYTEPYVDHNGTTITAPLVRAPGNIVTLTPGSAQRVWVIFNSEGVPAGKYETEIELKPLYTHDVPNRSIPVRMKVWNFKLPETHEWPLDCFFWTGQFTPLDETALLRLMHEYHVKWTMTESIHYKRGFTNDRRKRLPPPEGQLYDLDRLRNANQGFFEEARRLKMKIVFAWGTGPDLAWHEIMGERLEKMGFTHDDFIFKGGLRDEFRKVHIPQRQEFRDEVIAANPGWKFQAVYLSTPPPSGASLEDIEEAKLTDFFKNWAIISSRLMDPKRGPESIRYFRERGCDVWAYRCSRNMQTLPVLQYYRFFMWFAYLNDLDGVAFWTAYSAKGDDGFDHRDGYDDGVTWRGINKKPIPTKRLEAVREGLEDIAYMDLLKQTLEHARAHVETAELAEYEKLLQDVPQQLLRDRSQEAVDAWRLRVGEAIDFLVQKVSRKH